MKKTLKWGVAQRAELRWWQNYLKGKEPESYLAWKKTYWKNILDAIAPVCTLRDGMHILDAGCGPAGIFIYAENCNVDAVDPLLDQYEKELPHFDKNLYTNVHFFCMPLESFHSDTPYDIVFCMNAINHVSDIAASYDILCRAVKPGGFLVISIDAHNFHFFRFIFRMIPGDILHPHQYDLREYENFLTQRSMQLKQTVHVKHGFFFDHYVQVAQRTTDQK